MAALESIARPVRPEGLAIQEGTAKLVLINPRELVEANPQTGVINPVSMRRLQTSFAVGMFDPPQIAEVSAFDSVNGHVVRPRIIDGTTRTTFAANNPDMVAAGHPDFRLSHLTVNDVTDSLMTNPDIVRPGDVYEGKTTLTTAEYLRAVLPETVVHTEIAPDRIAALLINGWKDMVGEETATRFPAVAALRTLDNNRVPTATDDQLRGYLQERSELVSGDAERRGERARVEQAMVDTASIIRDSRIPGRKIAQAAFALISEGSDVIGEKEARESVYGLLHGAEVEQKLAEQFDAIAQLEVQRTVLAESVITAFAHHREAPDAEATHEVIRTALFDPRLNFDRTVSVITADAPLDRYDDVRKDINVETLTSRYLAAKRDAEYVLSETEQTLLRNTGAVVILELPAIQERIDKVTVAQATVQRGLQLQGYLDEQRETLIGNGVQEATIDQGLIALTDAQGELLDATRPMQVMARTSAIDDVIGEINQNVRKDVNTKTARVIFAETFGEPDEVSTVDQARIVEHFFGDLQTGVRPEDVRHHMRQFKALDPEVQTQVLAGEITLRLAISQQRETARPRPPAPTRVEGRRPTPPRRPIGEGPGSIQRTEPTRQRPEPRPAEPIVRRSDEQGETATGQPSLGEAERRRLERVVFTGATELTQVLTWLNEAGSNLAHETRDALRELVIAAGVTLYDRPNVALLVEETIHRQEAEATARALALQREQFRAVKDLPTDD